MSYTNQQPAKSRFAIYGGVIAVHIAVGYALIMGLGVQVARTITDTLDVINITPPPFLKPEVEEKPAPVEALAKEEEGAASAKNLNNKAAQITAPKPKVKLDIPPIVPTAPKPDTDNAGNTGASDQAGPGTGAGGEGSGTGSGRGGDGTGGGGIVTKARKTAGNITVKDGRGEQVSGSVTVYYRVQPNGRVTNCRVNISSGNPNLDILTCRLIEERFRYEPARNRQGEAVSDVTGWRQDWWLERGSRRIRN